MSNSAGDVGPLLSSVSVMLAAFGVFYTTQRDRIDREIEDDSVPDDNEALGELRNRVTRSRNVAAALAAAAFCIWLLLLGEISDRVAAAFDAGFSLDQYSTPDAVFFVAANAWLLLAIYIGTRWQKLRSRRQDLQDLLEKRGISKPRPGRARAPGGGR